MAPGSGKPKKWRKRKGAFVKVVPKKHYIIGLWIWLGCVTASLSFMVMVLNFFERTACELTPCSLLTHLILWLVKGRADVSTLILN